MDMKQIIYEFIEYNLRKNGVMNESQMAVINSLLKFIERKMEE